MRRDLYGISIADDETRMMIKSAYERFGTMLEPHGAVGWAGLEAYLGEHSGAAEPLAVSVETAHPAKFPEEIRSLIGIDPEVPPSLAGLESRPEQFERMSTAYEPFRDWLLARFR
jgi:threonine synthase